MTHQVTEFYARVNPNTGNSHTNKLHPTTSAQGAWISQNIPKECYKHIINVYYFDGTSEGGKWGKPINPSAGDIKIQASNDSINYGDIPNGDLKAGQANKVPSCCGAIENISVTVTGLTPNNTDVGQQPVEGTVVLVQVHSYR